MRETDCENGQHIVGIWNSCEETGLIISNDYAAQDFNPDYDEWFNFCPECGVKLEEGKEVARTKAEEVINYALMHGMSWTLLKLEDITPDELIGLPETKKRDTDPDK
jgi:hypothetical protein